MLAARQSMIRVMVRAAALLICLAIAGWVAHAVDAKMLWAGRGVQTAVSSAAFLNLILSCGSNCSFVPGTAGPIGTASVTLSLGSLSPAWSLTSAGTDNAGTPCQNYGTNLSVSSTEVLSNSATAAAGSYPGVCVTATQASVTNSPYTQAFSITGQPPGQAITNVTVSCDPGCGCTSGSTAAIGTAVATVFVPAGVFDNGGAPWPFTNQVAAINYNTGGPGVGYNVASPYCAGASCPAGATAYRSDDVNFGVVSFGSIPFNLNGANAGNSYNYNTSISAPGPYTVNMWLADSVSGGSWNVSIDSSVVATVNTPNTGSFSTYQEAASGNFTVPQGTHTLTLTCNGGSISFNTCGNFVAWQGWGSWRSISHRGYAQPAPDRELQRVRWECRLGRLCERRRRQPVHTIPHGRRHRFRTLVHVAAGKRYHSFGRYHHQRVRVRLAAYQRSQ